MTAPERIYLQGAADAPDCEDPSSGVTWCWHQIDDTDVEYVRADIAARATAEQSADAKDELRNQIRRIFLANGFTIKEGQTDLKPYVYQAAFALLWAVGALKSQQDAAIESHGNV